ncbi:hypothetical protein [Endozoicomonas sp. ALC066]|uniref:hypothetical protein n=1 Tax=Endozoicomonas sp. ALC066 TaxID=3403078 RepID=UPI003BB67BF3
MLKYISLAVVTWIIAAAILLTGFQSGLEVGDWHTTAGLLILVVGCVFMVWPFLSPAIEEARAKPIPQELKQ